VRGGGDVGPPPGFFPRGKKPSPFLRGGGGGGGTAVLNGSGKSRLQRDSIQKPFQPVASHYTDWAIPTHIQMSSIKNKEGLKILSPAGSIQTKHTHIYYLSAVHCGTFWAHQVMWPAVVQWLVNDRLEGMWKEAVCSLWSESQNFPGGSEEDHEYPRRGWDA